MGLPWGHLLDLYLLIFFFLFMRLIGLKIVLSNSNLYTIGAMLMIRSLFLNHVTIFYHFLITLILSTLIFTFTYENEKDKCLPFLDVNILFSNGKYSTTVYRKPTFTGLFTNFENRDYFMVGECVRFLFTSCEGSLNERVSAANE